MCMANWGLPIAIAAEDPQVIAWGDIPQASVPFYPVNTVGIASAHFHNLSVTAEGKLLAWPNQLPDTASTVPASMTNIVRMAGGMGHDVALRADGTIAAWGMNSSGQAAVPPGLSNLVAVAVGGYHSLALRADGSVVGWGDNSYGQVAIPSLATNVVAIAAGFYHSLALRADGLVIGWGDNGFGQTHVPPGLTNVATIAAGGDHSLALTAEGRVVAWGDDSYGQSTVPQDLTNALAVAAGDFHSLALVGDRTVRAWGPTSSTATAIPDGLTNAIAISAGGAHSLALVQDAELYFTAPQTYRVAVCGSSLTLQSGVPGSDTLVYQWEFNGTNLSGATFASLEMGDLQTNQTGLYSVVVRNAFGVVARTATRVTVVPSLVLSAPRSQTNLAGSSATFGVVALSTTPLGYQWSLNGTNLAWATNNTLSLDKLTPDQAGIYSVTLSNQYGLVSAPPATLNVIGILQLLGSRAIGTNVGDAVAIAASAGRASFAVRADGNVVGWGATGPTLKKMPIDLTNVAMVAVGYEHATALRKDGTLVGWGLNSANQVTPPSLTDAVAIAAGDFHSLALRADGSVVTWGDSDWGQMNIPSGLANIVAVAAGTHDSIALTSDGRPIAWGSAVPGETDAPQGLRNLVAVAAGQGHFLALQADGTVVGWGDNSAGQTNVPPGLTNAVMVAASGDTSMALTSEGRMLIWGEGARSQTNTLVAVSNVVAIAAGRGANQGSPHLALIGSGPPRITVPLVSRSVARGSTTSFMVAATGLLPLSYQWRFQGQDLPGETKRVLTLSDVDISQAGAYSVIVSNAVGVMESGIASLHVAEMLVNGLISKPADHVVDQGGIASLTVLVQGLDVGYQWLRNGITIPGAIDSILTLTNVGLGDAAEYSVLLTSSVGTAISPSVTLQVFPLRITFRPPYLVTYAGGSADFGVNAMGTPPFSYQWMLNGSPLAGATNSSLSLKNLQLDQAGSYSVWVTNVFGSTNSSAFSLTVPPSIVSLSSGRLTNFPGDATDLFASAQGVGPFSYQWYFDGQTLPEATNNTVYFDALTPEQTGQYFVTVSNSYGVVTSPWVNLTVLNLLQWQRDSTNPPSFLAIPAEFTSLAASSAGWAVASQLDGTVIGLSGSNSVPPLPPEGLSNAVGVAAGRRHGVVLRTDGSVACWGDNAFGQTNSPPGLTGVVSIAAGDFHNLALKSDGRVVAWGNNSFGQTNVPSNLSNVVSISASATGSWAVTRDGLVVGWGADALGHPVSVPPDFTNMTAAAAGGAFLFGLTDNGTLRICQNGSTNSFSPAAFTNLLAISVSGDQDLELRTDGTILSWSNPTNIPTGISNVVSIAAGTNSWALLDSRPPDQHVLVTFVSYDTKGFSVSLPTKGGRVYALEYKNSLTDSLWNTLPLVTGTGRQVMLTDPTAAGAQKFYRVRQW
jgi:alpha-tubulin suppressor-like RCC1 family protein